MLPDGLVCIDDRRSSWGRAPSPCLLSSCWAAKAVFWPTRLGTTVCLGSDLMMNTAATMSSGSTIASHHGSHARWRKVATRGGWGRSEPTGVAVTWKRRSTARPIQICLGGNTVNGHSMALPGSIDTLGSAKRNSHSASVSSAVMASVVRALALLRMTQPVARLHPARGPLGMHLRGQVEVRPDGHAGRRRGDLAAVAARHRDDLQRPRPRLRLGRARRVDVDLDLLLVGPGGAVGNEVGGGRRDRPPVLGDAAHAEVEVVDDVGLVADQTEDRRPLPGLDGHRDDAAGSLLVAGQAQRQGGRAGRRPGRAAGGRRSGGSARRRGRRGRGGSVAVGGGHRAGLEGDVGIGQGLGRGRAGRGGRLTRSAGRGRGGGLGRRRHRLHVAGRLPAQVLAAAAEIRLVGVLAPAAATGPHEPDFRAALTRSR